MGGLRVRLMEPMGVVGADGEVSGRALGGRRARLAFALLVLERGRPVPRGELALALWGQEPPASWEPSLREVISDIRAALEHAPFPIGTLRHEAGCYRFDPDVELHVDVEEASVSLARAFGMLDTDPAAAAVAAQAAADVTARAFLSDCHGDWADERRAELGDIRLRALEAMAGAWLALGDHHAAARAAHAALALEPLRESAHVLALRALTESGDRTRAIELHDRFRRRLLDELGVPPAAATQQAYLELLDDALPALRRDGAPLRAAPGTWRVYAPAGSSPVPERRPERSPLPARLAIAAPTPFVGHVVARDALDGAWQRTRGGASGLVLVAGEPGIGKTRLVTEAATAAHQDGAAVLYGASDGPSGAAFGALAQPLHHLISYASDALLRRHVEAHGHRLARLVPGLATRTGGAVDAPAGDPESERFQQLAAIAGLLGDAARERPLVLVLDDLHWADQPTLAAVRHLVAAGDHAPVLLIATYRADASEWTEGVADTLDALARDQRAVHLTLTGLTPADVLLLVEARGRGGGRRLAERLHEDTGGNPFYLVELLRDDARGEPGDGPPPGVREVVARRVEGLGEPARGILDVAAVCGREFSLDLLALVTGEDDRALVDGLERARAAGLLAEVPGIAGRFRFAHAIVVQALTHGLTPALRTRLHRRVAEALVTLGEHDPSIQPADVADQYLAALPSAEPAVVRRHAALAAGRALEVAAPEDAVKWYRRALGLLDDGDPEGERIDLLTGLGEAQRVVGDYGYRDTLLEASRRALAREDVDRLAAAVVANTRGFFPQLGAVDADRVDLLEAAVARLAPMDPRRAHALALLASERVWGSKVEERIALSDEALAIARKAGDDRLLAHVLLLRASSIFVPWTVDTRRDDAEEFERVAQRLGDPSMRFWAAVIRGIACGQDNDAAGVERCLAAQREHVGRAHMPLLEGVLVFQEAWWALVRSRLDEAEQLGTRGLAMGTAHNDPDTPSYYAALLVGVRSEQGRLGELVDLLRGAAAATPGVALMRALLARAHLEAGDHGAARALLDVEGADGFLEPPTQPTMLASLVNWAEVALRLPAPEHAEPLLRWIEPHRDQHVLQACMSFGSAGRCSARLHALLGHLDVADDQFAAASADLDRLQARGMAAEVRADRAALLLRRAAPGDEAAARRLATIAARSAEEVGHRPAQRAAAAVLATLDGAVPA